MYMATRTTTHGTATTTTTPGTPRAGTIRGTDRAGQSAGDGTTTGDPHGHGDGTILGVVRHGIPDGVLHLLHPIVPDGVRVVRAPAAMICIPAGSPIRATDPDIDRPTERHHPAEVHILPPSVHRRPVAAATPPPTAHRRPVVAATLPPTVHRRPVVAATPPPTTEGLHRPVAAAIRLRHPDVVAVLSDVARRAQVAVQADTPAVPVDAINDLRDLQHKQYHIKSKQYVRCFLNPNHENFKIDTAGLGDIASGSHGTIRS